MSTKYGRPFQPIASERFVQIAVTTSADETDLYALDAQGNVWRYGYLEEGEFGWTRLERTRRAPE